MTGPLGKWGYYLLAAGLFIACAGAGLELSLDTAYVYSQAFGWNWGENEVPRRNARFCLTYTVLLVPPTLLMLTGVHPLRLTMLTMILTVIALPAVVFPLLVIMNDPLYLKRHTNGRTSNAFVVVIVVVGALMALASVPLAILGGA